MNTIADIIKELQDHDAADAQLLQDNINLGKTIVDLRAQIAALTAPTVLYENAAGKRVKIPAGKRGGGSGFNTAYPLSKSVTKADVSYEVMFEGPFDWVKGGKLPGPVGVVPGTSPTFPTGGKPDPDHLGWSGRFMWLTPTSGTWKLEDGSRRKAVAPAELVPYIYHPGQLDAFGDNVWTGFAAADNTWIKVHAHYEMNTPGKPDGVLQVGFNDKVYVELHDYVYRTRPDVEITHFLFSVFAGGGDDSYVSTKDRYINIRNIKVTTK